MSANRNKLCRSIQVSAYLIKGRRFMISFAHFFVPYVQFLGGAAYNIGQTLEGLGIKPHFVVQEEAEIAMSQARHH